MKFNVLMSMPKSPLEYNDMIYPNMFLYWHKTDLMKPKRDTKRAKSDIQGRRNVTDYRISSLQMGCFIYILLTVVSQGDKQDFSFSSQQVEVHISIFHHNLSKTSGKKREDFYLRWQPLMHLAPLVCQPGSWIIAEIYFLFRFILSLLYAPSWEKSLGGKKSMSIIVSD